MEFIFVIIQAIPIDLILNIILVSIPEALFFVAFSLILLKQFQFLQFSRENIKKMALAVVPPAVFSNLFRSVPGIDINFMPLIGIMAITISVALVYRCFTAKQLFKVSLCVTLSFIISMAIQLSYFPLILYGTSFELKEFNEPGMLVVVLLLPERLVEYSLLVYLIMRRKVFTKINLFTYSLRHKGLAIILSLQVAVNLLYICVMTRLIFFDKILFDLPLSKQLIGLSIVTLYPIANLVSMFFAAYYVSNLETRKKRNIQEDLKVSISDIQFYLRRGEYDKISKELKYVEKNADQLD